MKRIRLPPRLLESDPLCQYINQIRDVVESLIPQDSPNSRMIETTRGTQTIMGKSGKGSTTVSGGPTELGMVFRGIYVAGNTYGPQDVVAVVGGPTAGVYVAVTAVAPNTAPSSTSQVWFQLWTLDIFGSWR